MDPPLQLRITSRYQQLPTPNVKGDDTASTIGPVEMVTVPAFGPEWGKSEMKDMTKAGKREKKNESRRRAWKEWSRDQRGLCGSKWLTRRVVVFILFGLCVMYVLSILVSFLLFLVLLNGIEIQRCDSRSNYDPSSSFLCVQQCYATRRGHRLLCKVHTHRILPCSRQLLLPCVCRSRTGHAI
jgi:hypothetical protein